MLLDLGHGLLLAAYAVLPVFYAAVMLNRGYRLRERAARRALAGTAVAAAALGVGMAGVFAVAVGGGIRVDQALLAGLYFFAVLVVLKGADAVVRRGAGWAFGTRAMTAPVGDVAVGANRIAGHLADDPPPPARWRRIGAAGARAVVLAGVGLPYVMAAAMTYRPKVRLGGDPWGEMRWRFSAVTFPATDGVRVSAWWIPAPPKPAGADGLLWGHRTALVCHGLGANKLNQLVMGRALHDRGYNLLAIDFRAHGESGGQFSTFGDHERRDVLGAVRWLKAERPGEARRVVGVGASLGGAALIAAAGEGTAEAAAIDGLLIYATYADLGGLAGQVSRERFPPGVGALVRHVGLPLASLHAGANLAGFAPREAAGRMGGRPLVVIHGRRDEIIPPGHAEALMAAASGPHKLILLDADHNGIVDDDRAAAEGVGFIEVEMGR